MAQRTKLSKTTRHRKHAQLAASFVVTVSAAHGSIGCKKHVVEPEADGATVSRAAGPEGVCFLRYAEHCPKGADCNPPPPTMIDCPANLRTSGDPPASTRRPAGKTDWLRVTPQVWQSAKAGECSYQPESFCPPPGKSGTCTARPEPVTIACTLGADAGKRVVSAFSYHDGMGECRKVPESDCTQYTPRGTCMVPDGDVIPCPK